MHAVNVNGEGAAAHLFDKYSRISEAAGERGDRSSK